MTEEYLICYKVDLDAFSQSIYTGCPGFFSVLTPLPPDYLQGRQLARWWAPPQGLWKTGQLPEWDEVTKTDNNETRSHLFMLVI